MKFNPYVVLGLTKEATPNQIKKAYRYMCKEHHPDVGGDPDDFLKIKKAYEILKDPKKRQLFDEQGIVLDDPENLLKSNIEQLFMSIVEKWLQMRIGNLLMHVPSFPIFCSDEIREKKEEADGLLNELNSRKNQLDKLLGYSVVEDDQENLFLKVLNRALAGTESEIERLSKVRYQITLVQEEFRRYKFNELPEDKAVEYIVTKFGGVPFGVDIKRGPGGVFRFTDFG